MKTIQANLMQAASLSPTRHMSTLFIADGRDFDPEPMAMLQAFYSRSVESIADRTRDMDQDKIKQSLARYYIGYGHRSIGQCGNFTLFLEDVSILAAKMIQHHPLYNGQETSTRYYDFSERPMSLPVPNEVYETYIRALYSAVLRESTEAYASLAAELGPVDAVMKRTYEAKAFDLSRAFLTAGYTTKLSWSTTFDQCQDQLALLINSPMPEAVSLGTVLAEALHEAYPSAMPHPDTYQSDWLSSCNESTLFFDTGSLDLPVASLGRGDIAFTYDTTCVVHRSLQAKYAKLLSSRQRGQPLPRSLAVLGEMHFSYDIDFGSWRDMHRHRNGEVLFPTYSKTSEGLYRLHPWYAAEINSLDIGNRPGVDGMTINESIKFLYKTMLPRMVNTLKASYFNSKEGVFDLDMMYYIPMGSMVRAFMSYSLPQAVYVAETRSARTVHPTARMVAHNMGAALRREFPTLALFLDTDAARLSRKRGEQTIMEIAS